MRTKSMRAADSHGARRLPHRLLADDWRAARRMQKRLFLLDSQRPSRPIEMILKVLRLRITDLGFSDSMCL
jgi:hypothetical protein